MFRDCLCLMRDYFWSKFQQTCAIFGGERVQKPSKRVVSWMLHRHENIWTFITWQPQTLKTTQSEPENRFFWAQFQVFFKNKIKTNIVYQQKVAALENLSSWRSFWRVGPPKKSYKNTLHNPVHFRYISYAKDISSYV